MQQLMSRPYKPNPDMCCEACVFGRGQHAEWCEGSVVSRALREYKNRTAADWQREYDRLFSRA